MDDKNKYIGLAIAGMCLIAGMWCYYFSVTHNDGIILGIVGMVMAGLISVCVDRRYRQITQDIMQDVTDAMTKNPALVQDLQKTIDDFKLLKP